MTAASERRERWAQEWKKGRTVRQIAERHGIGRQTVYHGLVSVLGPLGRSINPIEADVKRRRLAGESYISIAWAVKSTPGAVYQLCRRLGLVKRQRRRQ